MRLRANVKFLSAERERLKAEAEQARNLAPFRSSEPSCKRSDGTGTSKPSTSDIARDSARLCSPNRKTVAGVTSQPRSPEVSTRPPTSQPGCRDSTDSARKSWSTPTPTNFHDFEPIVERGTPLESSRCSGGSRFNQFEGSPVDVDAEPIVERGVNSQLCAPPPALAPRPPPPIGGGKAGKSHIPPPRPPEQSRSMAASVTDLAPRLTMDYFRQIGVRTTWRPGDKAYWRGQECQILRVETEDQPLYVVLRTPAGAEVTTDLCLLSDAPPNGQVTSLRTSPDVSDGGRPLRLAPLGDLCIDRPSALDRSVTPEQAMRTQGSGSEQCLQSLMAGSPDKGVPRSNSLPARGLSPVRAPSRQGRMHCNSPLQG